MKIILGLCLCISFLSCNAQEKPADTVLINTIAQQAKLMGDALVKKDYSKFVNYTHPAILKMSGGKEAMIELLSTSLEKMEGEGFLFRNISIGKPSGFVQYKNEIQAIIPQTIEMSVPGGQLVSVSSLVAVSSDNGTNWTFVDTQGKPVEELKKVIPSLSSELIIPAKTEPVFTKD